MPTYVVEVLNYHEIIAKDQKEAEEKAADQFGSDDVHAVWKASDDDEGIAFVAGRDEE